MSQAARIVRRREIQRRWGILGKRHSLHAGAEAERYALSVLGAEYDEVRRLSVLWPHFQYDIVARRGLDRHLYQITTRTHTATLGKHLEVAELLGCRYFVMFVRPNLTFHLVREVVRGTTALELRLSDLKGVIE